MQYYVAEPLYSFLYCVALYNIMDGLKSIYIALLYIIWHVHTVYIHKAVQYAIHVWQHAMAS